MGQSLLDAKRDHVDGIFMHVHKCAGTSVMRALTVQPNVISVVARPGNFPLRTGVERVPKDIWGSAFKFSIVRNPFSRVVSAYKMFAAVKRWRKIFPTFGDFVEFLRWADVKNHRVETEVDSNIFTQRIDNIIHHCSAFSNPKYRLDVMCHVARLEDLQTELPMISTRLGRQIEVPRLRSAGDGGDYRAFYDDKTRWIVAEIYAEDFERFGYSF